MKDNEHLVPVVIIDIANKLNDRTIRENELLLVLKRLEVIRDYCDGAIKKYEPFKNGAMNGKR